ncbi:MAG: hypothetical protein ACRC14_03990, partial [Paracoccaceae bacterium]
MNDLAPIGHNRGPDLLDEAMSPYDDSRQEAENWLDGTPVTNEAQMLQVDAITREMKAARKAVEDAKETEYRPWKTGGDAVIARYAPTLKDVDRIIKGLVGIVDAFKRKLAAERQAAADEAKRLAWEATRA